MRRLLALLNLAFEVCSSTWQGSCSCSACGWVSGGRVAGRQAGRQASANVLARGRQVEGATSDNLGCAEWGGGQAGRQAGRQVRRSGG